MFPPNLKIDAMYRGDDLLLGPDGPKEMDEDELLDAPVCALFFSSETMKQCHSSVFLLQIH